MVKNISVTALRKASRIRWAKVIMILKTDKYGRENESAYTYLLFLKKKKQWNGKKKTKDAI